MTGVFLTAAVEDSVSFANSIKSQLAVSLTGIKEITTDQCIIVKTIIARSRQTQGTMLRP